MHMDIATCNSEEPQYKYRLGTVNNRLLRGLNMFFWIQTCALLPLHLFEAFGPHKGFLTHQ